MAELPLPAGAKLENPGHNNAQGQFMETNWDCCDRLTKQCLIARLAPHTSRRERPPLMCLVRYKTLVTNVPTLTFCRMHQQPRCRRIHIPFLRPLVDAVPVHALVRVVDRRRQERIWMPFQHTDSHVRVARERVVQYVQAVTWITRQPTKDAVSYMKG